MCAPLLELRAGESAFEVDQLHQREISVAVCCESTLSFLADAAEQGRVENREALPGGLIACSGRDQIGPNLGSHGRELRLCRDDGALGGVRRGLIRLARRERKGH